VVKLEKRLDDSLLYLRDALPEYSTFDMNMKPVILESSKEVPVNKVSVVHLPLDVSL
jgi:large subunit ribosomal protein L19